MNIPQSLLLAKEAHVPLDMECGSLIPVRETDLAMIGLYHYSGRRPTQVARKLFPAYAINATLSGAWHYHRDGERYDLGPGHVTVGSPGDEYGCAHSPSHPNSNVLISLTADAIGEESEQLFKSGVMVMESLTGYIVRAADCSDNDEFDSLVFQIFDLVSHASYNGERRRVTCRLRAERVKRYIEHHFAENLTLADLAKSVGVNPYTCLRQFSASQGETPFAYITRCRVDKAKRLLKSKKLAIEEIANQSGFTTHSYFCRTFKRITGLSPTEFRRREST